MGLKVVAPPIRDLAAVLRHSFPEHAQVVDELAGAGPLSRARLAAARDEFRGAQDPRLEVLERMLESLEQTGVEKAAPNLVAVSKQSSELRKALDRYVIGQDFAKAALERFVDALSSGLEKTPKSLVIGGPPGVGKTELARGLSAAIHGDPEKVAVVECNKITNTSDLSNLFGSNPGFTGYEEINTRSPLSPTNIRKMFGDKRPVVVLFDEIDKLGSAAETEFWNSIGSCMQDGKLRLANGEVTDLSDAIFLFTSNAGMERAASLTGDAARKEFVSAAKAAMPQHMVSRLRNFTSADPLTQSETEKIAGLTIGKGLKKGVEIAAKRGEEISLSGSPEVNMLLGEIGLTSEYGARPLKGIIEQLLFPKIAQVAHTAQDEEKYTLRIKPGTSARDLALLKARFAESSPGIPEEYDADNFPLEFICTTPKPRFYNYAGQVPHADKPELMVLGSGAVGGRGFVTLNPGSPGAANELHFLQSGPNESLDSFRQVALPAELAKANASLDTAVIGPNKLFFSSVHMPEKGDLGETAAFIYDTDKKTFTPVAAPPLPMVGASVGGLNGNVVLAGGRFLEKQDGVWSVSLDAQHNNGKPISDIVWLYDTHKNEWTQLDAPLSTPRSGATVAEREGQLWLLGGEQVKTQPNGYQTSEASNQVEILDLEKLAIESGPDLPTPSAYGNALVDGEGRIQLMGGVDYNDFGRELAPKDTILRIDPRNGVPKWKSKDQLPETGAQLAVIPHAAGHVVGPFYDADGALKFQILK